jgi:hypothetical protein
MMTSFLLSLFLVNHSNRTRRTTTTSPSFFSKLSLNLNPEPYQDASNSTWDRRGSTTHVSPNEAISPRQSKQQKQKKNSWHLHKKIRKVAKLEIGDALEMRGRVMALMLGMIVGVLCVGWMGIRWVLGVVWR